MKQVTFTIENDSKLAAIELAEAIESTLIHNKATIVETSVNYFNTNRDIKGVINYQREDTPSVPFKPRLPKGFMLLVLFATLCSIVNVAGWIILIFYFKR